MSSALYEFAGLRFWSDDEIELRELFQKRAVSVVQRTLLNMNPAWNFLRTEGPILTPETYISDAYSDTDIFVTNHEKGGERFTLRAETTASSYAVARATRTKLPLCVWQVGKSFRRETNDGASAAKLRFNEFWQLEFQCIYSVDTKANYRAALMDVIEREITRFTGKDARVVESDRLPSYSESTLDIEVEHGNTWREMASCSIRKDFSENTRVCEIAIGLDRVASLASETPQ